MHSTPSTSNNAKNFLSQLGSRQFFAFLFFLLLSAVFWLFQVFNETHEYEYEVPLTITGVPDNVVITSEPPSVVKVTLRDHTSTLLRYRYLRPFAPITVRWEDVANRRVHVVLNTHELLKPIFSSLDATTTVVSARPEAIEFYYNLGLRKRLPVVFQGRVQPDSAYSLLSVDVAPRYVTVYASQSILDTLSAIYLRPIYRNNLVDTTVIEQTFVKMPGVKCVPEKAKVTVIADRMIEKTVEVPIEGVNFPASKRLRTFPSKVNITFQVGMSQYRKVTPESFVLVVNYSKLVDNPSSVCQLSLKSMPFGVRRARISPAQVEYIIEENVEEDTE